MRSGIIRSVLLIALSSVLAVTVVSQTRGNLEETDRYTRKTDARRFDFEVTDGTKAARLQVKFTIKSGRVEARLVDPKGNVRLHIHGEDGQLYGDSGDLEPIAGVWTLEMGLKDASGDYRINWTAR
ncbi:MAG TPA: hypothetical protein VNO70_10040 [Blastocatellia bacterium]|nr:hypothetical protein [Blastocatellia bacterium]